MTNKTNERTAAGNMGFCASWADGIHHQLLYYYLTSVPARQNAIEQKNKTSTFTYKFG